MDYHVTLKKFVISNISISADAEHLEGIQEPIKLETQSTFNFRPPVSPDDPTVLLECDFKIQSDEETLTISMTASGIFEFDSIPDEWLEPVKKHCAKPLVDACFEKVQNILKIIALPIALQ